MRVAVFSDVHGNIEGLRAVLAAIDKIGADRIICAGDMLGGGGGHQDLLDLLTARGVTLLMGNHEQGDLDLESAIHLIPEPWKDWALRTRDWLRAHLGRSSWDLIAGLPLAVSLEVGPGRSLLVCHATPTDPRAAVCGTGTSAAELRRSYGELQEQVVAYGHFHAHHVQWFDDKLLVNVASVGLRFDGKSAFSLFECRDDRWIVEQHMVCYDRRRELDLMRERGAPEPFYELLRGPAV